MLDNFFIKARPIYPNDLIKELAIEKVNEMTSCVSSMDLTNANYGKDVIVSLIVVE